MTPLEYAAIFLPLSLYLLIVAALQFGRRPRLLAGQTDKLLLGLALLGPILAGPVKMLPLQESFGFWGAVEIGGRPFDFVLWLLLGFLLLTLVIWWSRRTTEMIVIYNMTAEQLLPVLQEVLPRLETDCESAGNAVALPKWGVQFYVNNCRAARNVTLVATSRFQNPAAWLRIEDEIRRALPSVRADFHLVWLFLGVASLLCAVLGLTGMLEAL